MSLFLNHFGTVNIRRFFANACLPEAVRQAQNDFDLLVFFEEEIQKPDIICYSVS